jgi:aldehyde dehydrogenase family 7 protein A1
MSFHAIKHLRTHLVRTPFNMPAPVLSQRTALSAAKAQLSTRGIRALSSRASQVLQAAGLPTDGSTIPGVYDGAWGGSGEIIETLCPATGEVIGRVQTATADETRVAIAKAVEAGRAVRAMPGPKRGEVMRKIRVALNDKINELGDLVSLEMGKIKSEGKGEVQEFVDICDHAVGLSRSIQGRVLPSEREDHVIYEIPNPLGTVGILSAFNFPVAVYGWNFSIAFVAGNSTIWKPSPTTPLCSIAVTQIIQKVLEENGLPGAAASLVTGDIDVGKTLVASPQLPLISFTGSERVGREVGRNVQDRFGKTILELGGNNCVIVDKDADLSQALQGVLFAAVGTAGQRCTSTRRLLLHKDIAKPFMDKFLQFYDSAKPETTLAMGDPLNPATLIGPLHSEVSVANYEKAIAGVLERGGELLTKRSGRMEAPAEWSEATGGNWVYPVVMRPKMDDPCWQEEVFAPVLYVAEFETLEEAVKINNSVPQGLSSSLFTKDLQSMGKWLGPEGSDCGIVNVNVGTSGAEIGAAFGGNKSTGWGRESGGDAWKQYVRWSAATVNYGSKLPLAQGVSFGF